MLLGVYFVKSVLFVIPASLIYVSIGMAFDWPTACLINMGGILLEVHHLSAGPFSRWEPSGTAPAQKEGR